MPEPQKSENLSLDDLLESSLGKLKKAEQAASEPASRLREKSGHGAAAKTPNLESEVDKMLAEFQKMLPPEQLVAGEDRGAFPPPGSGSQAKTSTEQIEATFESLLKEPLGSDLADEFDIGGLEEMNQVIEQMMRQLTSKDVLYEPFAEMAEKLPAWIEENEGKVGGKEMQNYRKMLECSQSIVSLFRKADFDESKESYQVQIFEQMQQMHDLGPPPEGLLSEAEQPAEADATDAIPPGCKNM